MAKQATHDWWLNLNNAPRLFWAAKHSVCHLVTGPNLLAYASSVCSLLLHSFNRPPSRIIGDDNLGDAGCRGLRT